MIEVSIKEARRNLSALMDKVEQGDEILITRRGKRIAKLTVLERDARLPKMQAFRKSIRNSGAPMSETILKNRESERF